MQQGQDFCAVFQFIPKCLISQWIKVWTGQWEDGLFSRFQSFCWRYSSQNNCVKQSFRKDACSWNICGLNLFFFDKLCIETVLMSSIKYCGRQHILETFKMCVHIFHFSLYFACVLIGRLLRYVAALMLQWPDLICGQFKPLLTLTVLQTWNKPWFVADYD